jgi:hypothetical protein
MTRPLIALALTLSLLLLTGCQDDSPIVSAEVQTRAAGSRPLSPRQVQLVNTWLSEHRSGWSRLVLATPPPGDFSVTVHRQNGQSGRIEFYPQEGWQGALMYWGREPSENRQGGFAVDQVRGLRQELEKAQ